MQEACTLSRGRTGTDCSTGAFIMTSPARMPKKNPPTNAGGLYPEPGSNRHGLLHWCLRPARLPIPPSGLVSFAFKGLLTMQS